MSNAEQELDHHIGHIMERLDVRLQELGIANQMPTRGVMRIIQEISLAYWAEEEAQEMDASDLDIVKKPALGMPVPGFLLVAEDDMGGGTPIGFVSIGDDALYIQGHKITVGHDGKANFGKVNSTHNDGSQCTLPCRNCDDANVHLDSDGEDTLAICQNCLSETDGYEDKWLALGAWIVGKVKTKEEAQAEAQDQTSFLIEGWTGSFDGSNLDDDDFGL